MIVHFLVLQITVRLSAARSTSSLIQNVHDIIDVTKHAGALTSGP